MNDESIDAQLVGYPPPEILHYTIQDLVEDSGHIGFYLPYQWIIGNGDGIGNPCPEDPLTIYWSADVNGCDDRVTYKTTIGNLLDYVFEGYELWHEDPPRISSTYAPLFVTIRDALQKEIDKLNMWIDNAKPEGENND